MRALRQIWYDVQYNRLVWWYKARRIERARVALQRRKNDHLWVARYLVGGRREIADLDRLTRMVFDHDYIHPRG